MAVNLHSTHYRFGINELAETTHGWHAAEDANPAQGVIAVDTTFLLRFTVQETGGTAAGNTDQQFQCALNGGAFQNITTSSTVAKAVTTTVFANGADLTKRLSGTGTFESSGDGGTHDGLSGGAQNDIAASGNSETECALQVVSANVVNGDVVTFRLTSPDFTITNDVVPTLTVSESAPVTVTPGTASLTLTPFAPVVTATGYESTILADSPVAWWRLGEASGNPQDSAGTNHVTTVGGTPTYGATGAIAGNDAVYLSGTNEDFQVPDIAALDLGDTFTLEAWVDPDSSGAHMAIVSKAPGAYYLRLNPSNALQLVRSQTAEICTSTVTLGPGYHHCVATKSGATVHLYVDGSDVTGTVTDSTCADNTFVLRIGSDDGDGEWFIGSIDEVALYGTALSSTRVLAHYDAAGLDGSVTATPGTVALTLTPFAPVVTASDHKSVTPGTAALSLTAFAPVITASDQQTVTPGTAALALTAFAPTVAVSDNVTVTPGVASLSLTALTPSVTASDHKTVTPGTTALTLTAFAPTVTGGAGLTITPGTASLFLTAFAPSAVISDHQLVTPGTASLALTTFAPSVTGGEGLTVTPGTAALSLTAFAPTVTLSDHLTVTPGTATLALTTFAPSVLTSVTVTPGTASLALTAFAPVVTASDNRTVVPGTTALTLTAFAPTVTGTAAITGGVPPGVGGGAGRPPGIGGGGGHVPGGSAFSLAPKR
jgi:hypothetical protein